MKAMLQANAPPQSETVEFLDIVVRGGGINRESTPYVSLSNGPLAGNVWK
jgi:hypothetical protein